MTLRRPYRALFRQALVSAGLAFSAVLTVDPLSLPPAKAATSAMASNYLNLRTAPSTTSTILAIVPPEAALTVSGDASDGYYPVAYGENSGWVSTELVQVEMRTEPAAADAFDESKL